MDSPSSLGTCTVCEPVDDTFSQWQFWLFLILLVGAWCGTAIVTTFSDTICIEICKFNSVGLKSLSNWASGQDPYLYGKQRLWGSMSWGVLAMINGVVIDAVSVEGQEKNYAPAFYLMLVPLIADVVVSYRLKVQKKQLTIHF